MVNDAYLWIIPYSQHCFLWNFVFYTSKAYLPHQYKKMLYPQYSYRITIEENPMPLQRNCALRYHLCLLLAKVWKIVQVVSIQFWRKTAINYSIKPILCSHYRSRCKGLCQNKKSMILTQGYRYHKLRKTFGKFLGSYSEFLSKFGDISFQENVFKEISHPVFYGDLVYELRRVNDTSNFISSGSKIVKRLWRRQYDPLIIERTIGLVLGHCTALYRPFLKHCTLTNKAAGTIWRALSKPP